MEDDFIDDDEFANFIESDHRRSKHQGFFINKVSRTAIKSYCLCCQEVCMLHD